MRARVLYIEFVFTYSKEEADGAASGKLGSKVVPPLN